MIIEEHKIGKYTKKIASFRRSCEMKKLLKSVCRTLSLNLTFMSSLYRRLRCLINVEREQHSRPSKIVAEETVL